jgi:hypothetical protein
VVRHARRELLKDRAEEIGTGSPAEGARTDAIDRIACPVCGPALGAARMLDPRSRASASKAA